MRCYNTANARSTYEYTETKSLKFWKKTESRNEFVNRLTHELLNIPIKNQGYSSN